jgi:hypothetical protein
VVPPAMGTCSSGFGAAGGSTGDAELTGASGAVAVVTFAGTGAGEPWMERVWPGRWTWGAASEAH